MRYCDFLKEMIERVQAVIHVPTSDKYRIRILNINNIKFAIKLCYSKQKNGDIHLCIDSIYFSNELLKKLTYNELDQFQQKFYLKNIDIMNEDLNIEPKMFIYNAVF